MYVNLGRLNVNLSETARESRYLGCGPIYGNGTAAERSNSGRREECGVFDDFSEIICGVPSCSCVRLRSVARFVALC